jgi:hypothetical protein
MLCESTLFLSNARRTKHKMASSVSRSTIYAVYRPCRSNSLHALQITYLRTCCLTYSSYKTSPTVLMAHHVLHVTVRSTLDATGCVCEAVPCECVLGQWDSKLRHIAHRGNSLTAPPCPSPPDTPSVDQLIWPGLLNRDESHVAGLPDDQQSPNRDHLSCSVHVVISN